MIVSLWHRNVKLATLFALSVMLLLPSVPVQAFDGTGVNEEPTPIETVVAEEVLTEEQSAPQPEVDTVSSVGFQAPATDETAKKPSADRRQVMTTQVDDDSAPTVQTEPSPIQPKDSILVSSVQITGGVVDFVQLYNTDDKIADARDLSLFVTYHFFRSLDPDVVCDVKVAGHILPSSHLVIASRDVDGENVYPFESCKGVSADVITVELRRASAIHPTVNPDGVVERLYFDGVGAISTKQWVRKGFTSSRRSGVLSTDFSVGSPTTTIEADALYQPPAGPQLSIIEILPNTLDCSTDDTRLVCSSYLKVVNESNQPVDLSLYRLRTGALGQSASKYNMSELDGNIAAHSFGIIHQDKYGSPLALDKTAGTVWFEDAFGVVAYKNDVTPYQKANTVAWRGSAWAYDSGKKVWRWGAASPTTRQTDFSPRQLNGFGGAGGDLLKPCASDQYRNPATNRCKKIISTTSTLQPCSAGKFRNPATNRCKGLATTTSTLKACQSGEFRNPATNRCKKITSTSSTLQPCKPGSERNPATNRCRKVAVAGASSAAVDFPVEPVKDSAKAFVGWWALGGLLILGVGYATFEWRHEIASITRTLRSKISSKGK